MQTKVINLDDIRIDISSTQKNKIAKELGCTSQNVRNALAYLNNSKQAKQIRAKAREILLKEVEKIDSIQIGDESSVGVVGASNLPNAHKA